MKYRISKFDRQFASNPERLRQLAFKKPTNIESLMEDPATEYAALKRNIDGQRKDTKTNT